MSESLFENYRNSTPMQTVTVRTTQNVLIEYPVASLGDRILAYLFDMMIIIAYYILMIFLMVAIGDVSPLALIGVMMVPVFFYHLMFEIFMDGQSPGKRQMSIKVVRKDGTQATIGNYVIRWLTRLVEIDLLSGAVAMVTIAINGKGQRLGDIAAGTVVVKLIEQKEVSARDVFTMPEQAYIPVFPQVLQLNDQDIELIQQALELNRTSGNILPVMAITDKIKNKLGIQTDMLPLTFLYTIVKDYTQMAAASQ
jgi:uncharacterized RDD family membrane protein YckC